MNILPKKRWHVRTKENIARVRRDEAKAREEEKEKERRIELAEKESRLDTLRAKTRSKYDGSQEVAPDAPVEEHVNFFKDLEQGQDPVKKKNKEYEKDKKDEQDKYEKQIGYLTYLGQDTVESTGKVSWFNKLPDRLTDKSESEIQIDKKKRYDPLMKINSMFKKKEFDKKKKKSGKDTIDELRAKRLKREAEEKMRREITLAKLTGVPLPVEIPKEQPVKRQKYNSQFNPEIARQNRTD